MLSSTHLRRRAAARRVRTRLLSGAIAALALGAGVTSFGCSALSGGDLQTWRNISQGRYDKITAISLVLDRLIAQPAPASLTPEERVAWQEQTNWMLRTKSRLLSFGTNLKTLLERPAPSGANELDRALATGQLVNDYVVLGQEFDQMITAVNLEAEEDRRRVDAASASAAAKRTPGSSTATSGTSTRTSDPSVTTTGDDAGADRPYDPSASGGLAYSSPLKTRHDEASRSLSGLT